MRVAVIFFGVARGVPVTIASIKRNIYACNSADEFSFHTIASLNLVESITNLRAGEDGISLNQADVFLLNADVYSLVRQNDVAIAEALAAAQLQRDYFGNEWISVKNALHQLASLQRAWNLCLKILSDEIDYFLFVRPDLIYLDEIKLADIINRFSGAGDIAVPAWHSWGGFNDRFALADRKAAGQYAQRLSLVPEYCTEKLFHPESFLAYALEKAQCSVCELPVKAGRVRAHGEIKTEDFSESITSIPLNPKRFFIQQSQVFFDKNELATEWKNENQETKMVKAPLASGAFMLSRIIVDGYSRVSPLGGIPYLEFLAQLHTKRHVKRYLEIGTQSGMSLGLAQSEALAIDPDFLLDKAAWIKKPGIHLFEMTSDEFFTSHNPHDIFGEPVDLVFIDGMHLAEFVLRDFNNVERYCAKDSVIVLHDAIPQNFEMTERSRRPENRHDKPLAAAWTGDVWRIVPLLRRERPDLTIQVLDCPPTGLVLVSNLSPQYRMPPLYLQELEHKLANSELPEPEFWSFIESLPVADSRKYFAEETGEKTPDRSRLSNLLNKFLQLGQGRSEAAARSAR